MKVNKKKIAQINHFKTRCIQRFAGCIPDSATYKLIVDQITSNKSVHIESQSHRVKIKGVEINGQKFVVVYDNIRKTLVTVLPPTSEYYKKLELEKSKILLGERQESR